MKQLFLISAMALGSLSLHAQSADRMTPELLWSLKRVSAEGISSSGKTVYFATRQTDWKTEKTTTNRYKLNVDDGSITPYSTGGEGLTVIQRDNGGWWASGKGAIYRSGNAGKTWDAVYDGLEDAGDARISPDGKWVAFSREVLVHRNMGTDKYPDLPKTTAQVYTDLNYRHWDTWEDGKFSHIFIAPLRKGGSAKDIMAGEPYDAPQKPFGGAEDFVWRPDSKGLVYVCKKKEGKVYAQSTNTDLYYYDLHSGNTINWTAGMMGYDTNPVFSPDGRRIAWISMRREGFEADKTDIVVMDVEARPMYKMNLTSGWDGFASAFDWSRDSKTLFFTAPWRGTEQLFSVGVPGNLATRIMPIVRQITNGPWDVNGIAGHAATNDVIVSRTDMNHAAELWAVDPNSGAMRVMTHANDDAYAPIRMSRTELRMVTTSDRKQMGVWVIYPPDFDPKKKYPTLLYCQGGPQSALTQFYSFRWNFQLMAANGYIVVAPNRRGMPGWGVQWNESISGDWGGQPMRDYLSAIDAVSEESYVDKNRLGCIGASYGGYSVFMLAGMHEKRFKSMIAHDGLFDLKSWYGTTEELWFANWDMGGNYWSKPSPKSYEQFNPSNFVARWTAPIMIIQGGTDYRVPIEQGLEAFQAAQLKGIKSKLLYFPNENHWVLHAQNGIAWQREFFSWLKETL